MRGVVARFAADTGTNPLLHRQRTVAGLEDGPNDRPSVRWKARRPWQDRRTLSRFAVWPRTAASRRLAHGFRSFAKTMKEDRNVRYPSCLTRLGRAQARPTDRQDRAPTR